MIWEPPEALATAREQKEIADRQMEWRVTTAVREQMKRAKEYSAFPWLQYPKR